MLAKSGTSKEVTSHSPETTTSVVANDALDRTFVVVGYDTDEASMISFLVTLLPLGLKVILQTSASKFVALLSVYFAMVIHVSVIAELVSASMRANAIAPHLLLVIYGSLKSM